jgi:uncharacterized protein YukE
MCSIARQVLVSGWLVATLLTIWTGCSHDIHQERAATVKDHVEAFYDHLTHDRVAAAIRENEEIEAMAGRMGTTITRRVNQPGINQVDREWMDLKTANETAAQNWLALGQYLSIKKQYPRARATYQRVVDTYTGDTERAYREQAQRALRDLDMLDTPGKSN